ncbi:unnamed protein product [Arabidopsis halleri]
MEITLLQFWIFFMIGRSTLNPSPFHPSNTASLSPGFPIHLLSNINFLENFFGLDCIAARSGLWSDPHIFKYSTLVWEKILCHSSFPIALSNRHLTLPLVR